MIRQIKKLSHMDYPNSWETEKGKLALKSVSTTEKTVLGSASVVTREPCKYSWI